MEEKKIQITKFTCKSVSEYCFWSYNVLINDRKETRAMKNFGKKIDEFTKLTKLALEVGTLIAVIKPVLESIS